MRRNSRLTFYSAIGVQFGAGANNLEAIFKENVLDLEKLRSVCLKYEIPVMYRNLLWKVLLGVVPPHKESWSFIDDTREAQYHDIKRFAMLLNMRKPSSSLNWGDAVLKDKMTSKERTSLYERRAELISTVYHTKQSYIDTFTLTNKPFDEKEKTEYSNEEVERLARVIVSVFEDEWEAYWSLTRLLHLQTKQLLQAQIFLLSRLLELQQSALWLHLSSHSISIHSFAYSWFSSIFSSCFSSLPSLQKIWDKVIGVGGDLMACFGFAILSKLKPVILTIEQRTTLKKRLNSLLDSEFNIDNVLNSAVETASSLLLYDSQAIRAPPASSVPSSTLPSSSSATISSAPSVTASTSASVSSSTLPISATTSPVPLQTTLPPLPALSSSSSPSSSLASLSSASLPSSYSLSSSASTPSPSALIPLSSTISPSVPLLPSASTFDSPP